MSASTIETYMDYFRAFENAMETGNWESVNEWLHDDLSYTVDGVPFACHVEGKAPVLAAFQKSTSGFDATMDLRQLEIVSMLRTGESTIRIELVSGYGRESVGTMTAPVSMEAEVKDGKIYRLHDFYDPVLTSHALAWLATHMPDADPSYV